MKKRMNPVRFMEKGELLLGGFQAGAEREGYNHWEKYEAQAEKESLANAVDHTGFEMRVFPPAPEEERIFTGVEVTGRDILPDYELLVIPAALYAVFEINCKKKVDPQFAGIDKWLEKNSTEYPRRDWEGAPYIVCWYGRFNEEKVFEMWIPVVKK